jgi:hypothetical protein
MVVCRGDLPLKDGLDRIGFVPQHLGSFRDNWLRFAILCIGMCLVAGRLGSFHQVGLGSFLNLTPRDMFRLWMIGFVPRFWGS